MSHFSPAPPHLPPTPPDPRNKRILLVLGIAAGILMLGCLAGGVLLIANGNKIYDASQVTMSSGHKRDPVDLRLRLGAMTLASKRIHDYMDHDNGEISDAEAEQRQKELMAQLAKIDPSAFTDWEREVVSTSVEEFDAEDLDMLTFSCAEAVALAWLTNVSDKSESPSPESFSAEPDPTWTKYGQRSVAENPNNPPLRSASEIQSLLHTSVFISHAISLTYEDDYDSEHQQTLRAVKRALKDRRAAERRIPTFRGVLLVAGKPMDKLTDEEIDGAYYSYWGLSRVCLYASGWGADWDEVHTLDSFYVPDEILVKLLQDE